MKEEWRSVLIPRRVEFVLLCGIMIMLQLSVGSLVIHHMVSKFHLLTMDNHHMFNIDANASAGKMLRQGN